MTHAPDHAFEIRPARAEDAPALAGLLDELGFPTAIDVTEQRIRALAQSGETVLVGARAGTVLGFAALHVTPVLHRPTPVGRVTALVVTHAARGQGLGRALVTAAERHSASAGCALVEITSHQDLAAAHAFYQRIGYTITSYRFRKELPPRVL